jgi:hypothetical protein
MKLSLQLGRGLIALTLGAAFGACAFTLPDDKSETQTNIPDVAHSRLAIVDLHDTGDKPHWVVAGVRVGDPVYLPEVPAQHAASHMAARGVGG